MLPILSVANKSLSWGNEGDVQPTQGTPARVLLLVRFHRSLLQTACVKGPWQPRLKNIQPRPPSSVSSTSYSWILVARTTLMDKGIEKDLGPVQCVQFQSHAEGQRRERLRHCVGVRRAARDIDDWHSGPGTPIRRQQAARSLSVELQSDAIAGIWAGGVDTAKSRTRSHRDDELGSRCEIQRDLHPRSPFIAVIEPCATRRGDDAAFDAQDIQLLLAVDDPVEKHVVLFHRTHATAMDATEVRCRAWPPASPEQAIRR